VSQVGTLSVAITGDNSGLNSAIQGADHQLGGFRETVGKIGVAIAGVFAVKKIADFVSNSIKLFTEFESATSTMFASMGRILTDEEKDRIIADIREISEAYGIAAVEVTRAADSITDLGVPVEELNAFLATSAELAKVLGTDIGATAPALARTIQGLGGDWERLTEVADTFFAVADAGQVEIGQLETTFAKLLPVAKDMGLPFSDLAAHVTAVAQQGIPARTAISGLQGALDELSDTKSKIGELFQTLTGTSFTEFIAAGHSLGEAFAVLRTNAEETGTPVTQLFTNIEAGKMVLATTGEQARLVNA